MPGIGFATLPCGTSDSYTTERALLLGAVVFLLNAIIVVIRGLRRRRRIRDFDVQVVVTWRGSLGEATIEPDNNVGENP